MENIKFLGVEVVFRRTLDTVELMAAINIGAVSLKKGDRDFILDPMRTSFTHPEGGGTEMFCKLSPIEEIKEDFPDCKFNATETDFMARDFDTAEMFLDFEDDAEEDYISEVESITLVYKVGECTYNLDLEPETFEIVD